MTSARATLEQLRINPDWAKLPLFDRKGWKRLPFGAFAESVNQRVEPSDAADEIYVGLDNLDSQNLHIRRWGKGSDVIGTKLRFRKDDIIFGRRRAYQRKLAVAEFDGICSAHAMVVRARPELVLPEFLPFLMMGDRFMNRAVEISVGSLSPTINWKALKLEEFDLPPLGQQRRVTEILWAVDEHIGKIEAAHLAFAQFYAAFADERLFGSANARTTLGALAQSGMLDIQTGPFGTVLKASSYVKNGTPIVNPVNMRKRRLHVNEGPFLGPEECERLSRYKTLEGDILLGRKGDVGRAVLVTSEYSGYIVGSDLIRLRISPLAELSPEYLYCFLLAPKTRTWVARHATGTTMLGLNEKLLHKLELPIPPIKEQEAILCIIQGMNNMDDSLLVAITASKEILLSLANSVNQ